MSRYVKYLIDQVRKETENEDSADFIGIQDSEFIQYINDAQYNIQSIIVAQHPDVFVEQTTFTGFTSGDSTVDIPKNAFLGNKLLHVEYSPDGSENSYYPLDEVSFKRKNIGIEGAPAHYTRYSGKIALTPDPNNASGKLRVFYIKRINELDLRRAEVKSVTLGSNTITTLKADPSKNIDKSSLEEHNYICVVDKNGETKMKNIPLLSINSSTGLVTLDTHTFESGETISAGDFIVGGKFTSTHSELDASVERYLIAYAAWKILKRDSSIDSIEIEKELKLMSTDIVKSYSVVSEDIQYIPQLTSWDDWTIS